MSTVLMDDFNPLHPSRYSNTIGYTSGIGIQTSIFFPISAVHGVRLGLGWIQKGYSSEVRLSETLGELRAPEKSESNVFRLNYFTLPILAQFSPIYPVRILAGPTISYFRRCTAESIQTVDGVEEEPVTVDCAEGAEEALATIELSLRGGVGVDIPVAGTFSVSIDGVYDLAINRFFTDPSGLGLKSRGFLVKAGVSLPIGL